MDAERDSTERDEVLPDLFWSVARRLRGASRDALAPWDITPGSLRALRVLSHHGSMRLSELSDHLQIAPRSTTEVVDALESRGLVRRLPDPGDRRATLAELTEQGASVFDAIRAARGSEAERVFGRLTEADRADLARILAKLRDLAPGAGVAARSRDGQAALPGRRVQGPRAAMRGRVGGRRSP